MRLVAVCIGAMFVLTFAFVAMARQDERARCAVAPTGPRVPVMDEISRKCAAHDDASVQVQWGRT